MENAAAADSNQSNISRQQNITNTDPKTISSCQLAAAYVLQWICFICDEILEY